VNGKVVVCTGTMTFALGPKSGETEGNEGDVRVYRTGNAWSKERRCAAINQIN
jgi:hypothetical protein